MQDNEIIEELEQAYEKIREEVALGMRENCPVLKVITAKIEEIKQVGVEAFIERPAAV